MVIAEGERRLLGVPGISFGYNCWTDGERERERVLTHLDIVSDIHEASTRY
jgi:hypothetical protein